MTSSSTALHSLLVMLVVAPSAGEELISSSHGLGSNVIYMSRVLCTAANNPSVLTITEKALYLGLLQVESAY